MAPTPVDHPPSGGKDDRVEQAVSRTAWHHIEAINAVVYFSPECRDGLKNAGLRGFWMGYFAGRAAPMGAVSAGVVEATFYNFAPAMVRRSIPDAWTLAGPASVLSARRESAAAALRRLAPGAEAALPGLLPQLLRAVENGEGGGRPLFSANRDLSVSDDLAGLWQVATTLREHRGDGPVAVLAEADVDGCEAHVLLAATEGSPPELFLDSRGWSSEAWQAASDRLRSRGLVTGEVGATDSGRRLRSAIKQRTDELAMQPYFALSIEETAAVIRTLSEIGRAIVESGEIPFPNPMGLPPPQA
jgi:hypothetical protein